MNIQLKSRLLAATLLSLTAAGCGSEEPRTAEAPLAAQEAPVEERCVEGFGGVKNCALGRAALKRTEKGISVFGLEDVKADGVSSVFPRATSWEMDTLIGGLGEKQQGMALLARDGDQVVSSVRVEVGKERDQLTIAPLFTGAPGGSAYVVNVYQGGSLMGTNRYQANDRFDLIWYNIHIRLTPVRPGFRNHTPWGPWDPIGDGACVWGFGGGQSAFSVNMAGRPVSGDYLEIVEEVSDGHYPYTSFTGIDVMAAASELTIRGESIVQAK